MALLPLCSFPPADCQTPHSDHSAVALVQGLWRLGTPHSGTAEKCVKKQQGSETVLEALVGFMLKEGSNVQTQSSSDCHKGHTV